MGLPAEKLPHYTYEEYRLWEGDWEIIEGLPFAMSPSPNMDHQSIQSELNFVFRAALRNCANCKILPQMDWKVSEDTVLCPDISILCRPFERGAFINKTPELVVEIHSTSTVKKDRTVKYDIYQASGVKYYIIMAHPLKKIIEIYALLNGVYEKRFDSDCGEFEFELGSCTIKVIFDSIW
jgi:Uma2 family endonuclease